MFRIFAKLHTDEKICVYCHRKQIGDLMKRFHEEYGGDWVFVDEIITSGEILKFNDNQTYRGFEPDKPDDFRYCKAIKRFKLINY